MKKARRIYIFLAFSALCWLMVAGWAVFNGRLGSSVDPIYGDVFSALETNPSYVYDYDDEAPETEYPVFGAIFPTPAVNSKITAQAMAMLSEYWSTKLVLVISFADHLDAKVVTSKNAWQTSFGVVQVNSDAVDHILRCGAVIDNREMTKMTDYYDFLPYFSRYFPDKRIVPLVFDTAAGITYVNDFLDELAAYHDGYKVIILAGEDQSVQTPLFSAASDVLISYFDAAETTNYGNTLSAAEGASLEAMKHILQYDGNDAVYLVTDTSVSAPSFGDLAIFYGKKE
jgi:AmmeMemoRadiSam system protein B